jgi:hypothetical protein
MSRNVGKVLAVLLFLFLLCGVCLPPVEVVRDGEGWPRSANSLKYFGLALQGYHEVHGRLPPAAVTDKDGKPLYSWRVLLLPYLEEDHLYKEFKLDEPWDSPHNKPLADETPRCYTPHLGGPRDVPGMTHYQALVGPGTAFEQEGLTWADFPDGLAQTLLVVEATQPVPWSKPADLVYDPNQPLPAMGGLFTKAKKVFGYELKRKAGFVACFGDGTTHFVPADIDELTLRSLITRNGGEPVDLSKLD